MLPVAETSDVNVSRVVEKAGVATPEQRSVDPDVDGAVDVLQQQLKSKVSGILKTRTDG